MRHQVYDALGLRVTVERDATLTIDYRVDANVLRLTKEVEEYAREQDEGSHLLTAKGEPVSGSRSDTAMSIVVMK
jgi:hypothetical protein